MPKTAETFRNKKNYKELVYPTIGTEGDMFPKPIDFWYERTLYGRVDERQDPIYISSIDNKRFKQLDPNKQIFALNFVVDAFLSLQRHIRGANSTNKLNSKSILLDIEADSGFVDIDSVYGSYLQTISNVVIDNFLSLPQHSDEIIDFSDFLNKFLEFLDKYAKTIPITKSAYIKSQYCTPLISGLMIELARESHSDDAVKEKWISDPNYEFYTRAARQFGFIVDKNAPWRLVAHIMSPRMHYFMNQPDWHAALKDWIPDSVQPGHQGIRRPDIKYSSPSGDSYTNSVRTLFKHYYRKAHTGEIGELQNTLIRIYKQFYDKFPSFKKIKIQSCSDQILGSLNKIASKTIDRQDPSDSIELKNVYSNLQWFDFYLRVRLKEENRQIHQSKHNRIISNLETLIKGEAEQKVDNGFSLWYLNEAIKGFPKLLYPLKKEEFLPLTFVGENAEWLTEHAAELGIGARGYMEAVAAGTFGAESMVFTNGAGNGGGGGTGGGGMGGGGGAGSGGGGY